ncbi:hypothetical protein [Desulfofustis glycolicus]|uniref:Uncharacterized protein n=1 Tax=Desulfofustis glycolicus DSM 9705 TaxID=1121409 RepID=A0A1M5SA13_9BACT|nr:hypothetical protein [Desulfofustis glycolicus]MCB2216185.1 hypothetical protein [Desulfobulbaceae bacterium]SHH35472.1 hypothetical protein SAMN02745124_00244 [Desulfofustis glycolicus DSM 9705]
MMPQKDGNGPLDPDQRDQVDKRSNDRPDNLGTQRPGRGLGRGGGQGRRDGTGGGKGRGGGGRGGRRGQNG